MAGSAATLLAIRPADQPTGEQEKFRIPSRHAAHDCPMDLSRAGSKKGHSDGDHDGKVEGSGRMSAESNYQGPDAEED